MLEEYEKELKMLNKTKKTWLVASLAASLGMGLVNVASAQDHHVYHHAVKVGWHGDRYWDGHRYWAREEWEHHHAPHHMPPPPPHRY
jgi:hypothetical protein